VRRTFLTGSGTFVAGVALSTVAAAEEPPGVTATEIKIGNTAMYNGPLSAYSVIPRTEAAFFNMINEQGGINGRKINFISLDDGYSPPKTVEQMRRLVEQEGVALIFNSQGTPTNTAVQKYLNDRKVPQLFVGGGADKWGNYKQFPGPSAGNPAIASRRRFMPSTFSNISRMRRSASSTRTTMLARTTSLA
jgi:branched-chain amino acid transport system substrate-binding protein